MKKSDKNEIIKLSDLQDIIRKSNFSGICYFYDKKHGIAFIRGNKLRVFASICCLISDLARMLDVSPKDVLNEIKIGFED